MTSQARSLTITADTGLSLHALEWCLDGADRGHVVVLLHGLLSNCWCWTATAEAGLADRFRVVAPDARGHGDSDRVGAGGYYHFLDYVADLSNLIDQLGAERLSLVGHSMGGSIASYFAGTFPERVAHLALLEGTGPPDDLRSGPERTTEWLDSCRRARRRPRLVYDSVPDAADRLMKADRLLDRQMALYLAEHGTREVAGGQRTFKHDPLHHARSVYPFTVAAAAEFWRQVRCPVLLVEGGESYFRLPGAEAERRHGCFADHRLETIPGAGHAIPSHRPTELAELLIDFLS